MHFTKQLRLSKKELDYIVNSLDGYIWVAIDIKKGTISAGDTLISELKWSLLHRKSNIKNIFGIGLDLITGEIDFISSINIKRIDPLSTKEVPDEKRERIEDLIRYFFSELPIFKTPIHPDFHSSN
jgi:hypothetical protein